MTTVSQAREAIYQAFVDAWDPPGGPLKSAYTFDNEQFDPPTSAAWVRLTVRHNDSDQTTLGRQGNRKFGRPGSVLVQVFLPTDTGRASADSLADDARDIFEGTSLAGTTVRFYGATVREAGKDGKWDLTIVEAPFDYEQTK